MSANLTPGAAAIWVRRSRGGPTEKVAVVIHTSGPRFCWVKDGERLIRVKRRNLQAIVDLSGLKAFHASAREAGLL